MEDSMTIAWNGDLFTKDPSNSRQVQVGSAKFYFLNYEEYTKRISRTNLKNKKLHKNWEKDSIAIDQYGRICVTDDHFKLAEQPHDNAYPITVYNIRAKK